MYPHIVGVLGSSEYLHPNVVRDLVLTLGLAIPSLQLLTRGRGRVARTVIDEANRCGIPVARCNEHELVACAEQVHAFWDGRSLGTRHAIALARAEGVPVSVHGLVE